MKLDLSTFGIKLCSHSGILELMDSKEGLMHHKSSGYNTKLFTMYNLIKTLFEIKFSIFRIYIWKRSSIKAHILW